MKRSKGHLHIARRATARGKDGEADTRALAAWEGTDAYVLLAEPGSGKTESFEMLAGASPAAVYVRARDFVTLNRLDEWRGKTLYIDGLDEMRADTNTCNPPLDAIRTRLDVLGRPRFRLSCREADWFGAVDRLALAQVAPYGAITELQLEPLTPGDVVRLLAQWPDRVADPGAFLREADAHGLSDMLLNPLMLELLVDAVRGPLGWPRDRSQVFNLACRQLATEQNEVHQRSRQRRSVSPDMLLDDAGLLAAVLLLSGVEACTLRAEHPGSADLSVDVLPAALAVQDAHTALSCSIFKAEGDRRWPRHRSIAEYLAARAVGERVEHSGLPIGRVLALMTGEDGGIVEPLRGLAAWLAVHCPSHRRHLIQQDPLGVVLYGDVSAFPVGDKVVLLKELAREAKRSAGFRHLDGGRHRFRALGTSDMVPAFLEGLESASRDEAHIALLDCALDAIRLGDHMPALVPALAKVVIDDTHLRRTRVRALEAWWRQSGEHFKIATQWLDDIEAGSLADSDDELSGKLLDLLYPTLLRPTQALSYLRGAKDEWLFGAYWKFWSHDFAKRTADDELPELLDALASRAGTRRFGQSEHLPNRVAEAALLRALHTWGARQPVARLYQWLGVGMSATGGVMLQSNAAQAVGEWLAAHPALYRAMLDHGYRQVSPDQDGKGAFWQVEVRLFVRQRPAEWTEWLLEFAAHAPNEPMARHCFESAAHAAAHRPPGDDGAMEMVERWIRHHAERWPAAPAWLKQATTCDLETPGEFFREDRARRRSLEAKRQKRRQDLEPLIPSLRDDTAPPGLLHQLALACDGRFADIRGETAIDRVQDFLVGSIDEAQDALVALERSLDRIDLPAAFEILEEDRRGRQHLLRTACLAGAQLAERRSPQAPRLWPDDLARRLVAFHLTEGRSDLPEWFKLLAGERAELVADILIADAVPKLKRRPTPHLPVVRCLRNEPALAKVARLVAPDLVRAVPAKCNEEQLRLLNLFLLPALLQGIQADQANEIVNQRLSMKSLDAGQRIAWLVAKLHLDAAAGLEHLVKFVGASQSRAAHLARALEAHGGGGGMGAVPSVRLWGRLIELIAPHAHPQMPKDHDGWEKDEDRRRDLVQGYLTQLAASSDRTAADELARLGSLAALRPWERALNAARFDHERLMRSSSFRHVSPSLVAAVLANQAPANPKDLAALLVERLHEAGKHLRGAESTGVRLMWTDPTPEAPSRPRSENECRDRLFDKLERPLLQIGVSLEKEASAAFDTRADLRASAIAGHLRIRVPIEIKLESHKHLWTAMKDQLARLYTTDPASGGTGIYLVLWFGVAPRATSEGQLPQSAGQLKELLRARLGRAEAERLNIVVLDLSLLSPAA
jgi:hypothetical protein